MYNILLHAAANAKVGNYLDALKSGVKPGRYLEAQLATSGINSLDVIGLLELLVNTKKPQIFAESTVRGDGTDWNAQELSILGDLSIAVPVSVLDDGRHRHPQVHQSPFTATLLFTPGALLRNGQGVIPADWDEVTENGGINQTAYNALYERRLHPLFAYANEQAKAKGCHAVITLPGLGCGQFAGPFHGQLGKKLQLALESLLERHGHHWPHIAVVWFDPYAECASTTQTIHGIEFKVRPLTKGHDDTPQLCLPKVYMEHDPTDQPLHLFSIVAWDHVSWPGNDFYAGARATDDGVKAAATTAMMTMTGFERVYDSRHWKYLPPAGYANWEDVVRRNNLVIQVRDRLRIYTA